MRRNCLAGLVTTLGCRQATDVIGNAKQNSIGRGRQRNSRWCGVFPAYLHDVRTRFVAGDKDTVMLIRRAEELVRLAKETGLLPPDSSSQKKAAGEAVRL